MNKQELRVKKNIVNAISVSLLKILPRVQLSVGLLAYAEIAINEREIYYIPLNGVCYAILLS